MNIAIAFSVDVEDPPAPVAAVAPTEPATTPTADATPLVVVSAGTIALNEPTSVGSDPTAAPGSPAQTWGEISSAALDEDNGGPAAWRLTEAYTGRSPRDRAVIDALIAAAGQTGVIPAGTSVNIMYTSEGITAESTAAAAGQATVIDPSLSKYEEKLGSDSELPLGAALGGGGYASVAWSSIINGSVLGSQLSEGQVAAFRLTDRYTSMSSYHKAKFERLLELQRAANAAGEALGASADNDASALYFEAQQPSFGVAAQVESVTVGELVSITYFVFNTGEEDAAPW